MLGGGRYDGLAALLGGGGGGASRGGASDLAGVGWAAGIERVCLLQAALEEGRATPDGDDARHPRVAVVAVRNGSSAGAVPDPGDRLHAACLALVRGLRSEGVPATYEYTGRMGQLLAAADKRKVWSQFC